MNKSFLRYWLPLSIVTHLVLLVLMQIFPMSIAQGGQGERLQEVTVLNTDPNDYTPVPPDQKPQAEPPVRHREPLHAVKLGVAHPKTPNGTSASDIVNPMPGPGHKPTAPPKLMSSPGGRWAAAPGLDGGTGNNGTDPGPSGPSTGAAAHGGPNPGYPKLAEERGAEGTVVISVNVSATGGIAGLSVARSSGDSDLDNAALRAARSWHFSPAVTNGRAASGTVTIRFRFANGTVVGS